MRIAAFVDQVFWRDGRVISTAEAYALFLASFVDLVGEIIFIGREAPAPGRAPYSFDHPAISLLPLPYYTSLYRLGLSPRVYGQVRQRIREHASGWDAILLTGPNPVGQLIARQCIAAGVPVILVVRQNLVQLVSAHRGVKRIAAVTAALALEWDFRRLARDRTVLTVGMEMADVYRRRSDRVHNHFPCLIEEEQFRRFLKMEPGADPSRLLCVGRLSPEKGHRYLIEAMAQLKTRESSCHLDIVGDGPLEQELKALVVACDLGEHVSFHGYVPYGPTLFELYQSAGALVVPSLTEGFPQVISEALCIGLPTVATTVGGIPSFLRDGETAMLVPPHDAAALAHAVERLMRDRALHQRLRRNGQILMEGNTLEKNRARVVEIVRENVIAGRG